MKKISKPAIIASLLALAVAGSALAQSTSTTTSTATSTPPGHKPVDIACVRSVVEKREIAVQTAWQTFSSSTQSALTNRGATLQSAWSISDREARKDAIKMAWKNFKDARKAAKKNLHDANRNAWETFRTDRRACGGGKGAEEPGATRDLF